MKKTHVDITPHPAILSVLGEIEFKPWQCIAELIDNSVDSFLKAGIRGNAISEPIVKVALGKDTVVVKDNGPGMTLDSLELSVKAGWSSNDRFGSLGLYGVGFNIATARLGTTTTIWTTQSGDTEWVGLVIDLREIAKGGSYQLEIKRRAKSDKSSSGTEIEITNLKPDWSSLFLSNSWVRNNVTKRLERVYSTMLRIKNPQPIGFTLHVNNRRVSAWEHCVWPEDWEVYRRDLNYVRPVQEIDFTFGEKYVSRSTGEAFETAEYLDPDDIVIVKERVYGWIGIQRFTDEDDFGIDILRNGRKIEVGCKDLFYWEDEDGKRIPEYPIDDPRQRGRIVGEIHLDHGYVHYTKHRFEREHISWKHLLKAIRDDEPLVKRKDLGFEGANESPLGVLFRTFRRNSPLKSQTYWDVLVLKENEEAKRWSQEYRKGNADYLDENWWKTQIEEQDKPVPTNEDEEGVSSDNNDQAHEDEFFLLGGTTPPIGTESNFDPDSVGTGLPDDVPVSNETDHLVEEDSKQLVEELSIYNLSGIGPSGRTYNIEVFKRAITGTNNKPKASAWESRLTERGMFEITLDVDHSIFASSSFSYLDAVLSEVAYMVASEEQAIAGTGAGPTYSEILSELRKRYATSGSLDTNRLHMEVDNLRTYLSHRLSMILDESDQEEIVSQLPQDVLERVRIAYAQGGVSTSIIEYVELQHLIHLFQEHPELFFNAGCFSQEWTPDRIAHDTKLLDQHRNGLIHSINLLLLPLADFSQLTRISNKQTYPYRLYIRSCLSRLSEYMSDRLDE